MLWGKNLGARKMSLLTFHILNGFAEEGEANGLTYAMMAWAGVMTIAVGIIIAAVVIRHRRKSQAKDVEISSASLSDVNPTVPSTPQEKSIAQVQGEFSTQALNC